MKRFVLVFFCCSWLCCGTAFGAGWPQVEKAVAKWEGAPEAILRTTLEDPLGDPSMQSLLELLLERGFIVVPEKSAGTTSGGLVLDVRRTGSQTAVAVIRAEDGAILAFERQGPQPSAAQTPARSAAAPPPEASPTISYPTGLAGGLLDVPGNPVRLAVTDSSKSGAAELLLLSDGRIDRVRLSSRGVEPLATCEPPVAARALYVDTADLNEDGRKETAVVMAEDHRSIDTGTDSSIHGWLFPGGADRCDFATDFNGYLRMSDGRALFQSRAAFAPFGGGVLPLRASAEGYRVGENPVPWGGFDIYSATPLPGSEGGLAWVEKERLALVDLQSGRALPGGRLPADLGPYEGPEMAVRLKEPRYVSGFGAKDRVAEEYHALPRRLALGPDGGAYTIDRGRRMPGLALLRAPSGQDSLVRLSWDGRQLVLDRPFPGVDSFILDFALLERSGKIAVVLLLNEKSDGSGQSWLLVQDAR